jgi:hypothetical protein
MTKGSSEPPRRFEHPATRFHDISALAIRLTVFAAYALRGASSRFLASVPACA